MKSAPRLTALAASLSLSACSIGVRGPGKVTPGVRPICTSSRALPRADLVVGGLFAVFGTAALFGPKDEETPADAAAIIGIAFLVLSAPFLIAGAAGSGSVSSCIKAK